MAMSSPDITTVSCSFSKHIVCYSYFCKSCGSVKNASSSPNTHFEIFGRPLKYSFRTLSMAHTVGFQWYAVLMLLRALVQTGSLYVRCKG